MHQMESLQQYILEWNEDFYAAESAQEHLERQIKYHVENGEPYPDIKDIQVVLDLWVLETRSRSAMESFIHK